MASKTLGRGSLLECTSSDPLVSSYLARDKGKLSIMLVNKYPESKAEIKMNIPVSQVKQK
jgi:hypothetical protein